MGKKAVARAVSESVWSQLHAAYVFTRYNEEEDEEAAALLRSLARRFGVSFREADRRATLDAWELERAAEDARAWLRGGSFAAFPTDLDGFVKAFAANHYGHLVAKGPEGEALARAYGRDVWWRALSPIYVWEARQALESAEVAFDQSEGRPVRSRHAA